METKAKVVMLPTNERVINTKEYQLLLSNSLFWTSKIEIERYDEGWFFLNNSSNHNSCAITIPNVDTFKHQHLYIISDDEIKKGDYYIIDNIPELLKNNGLRFIDNYCKKVIATTDTSLEPRNLYGNSGLFKTKLPRPSQQFIKKFVEEYNKGNIIEDVLVEYEEGKSYSGNEGLIIKEWLKINPKDNPITIKKAKDSYSREEVDRMLDEQASKTTAEMMEKFKDYKSREEIKSLLFKFTNHFDLKRNIEITLDMQSKWLEENL